MKTLLEKTIESIQSADQQSRQQAREHIMNLTMPVWALGELLDLAVDLAGITRSQKLPVSRKKIVLMAGDHGIVAEGVCPQGSEVTSQMMYNFMAGGAGINVLANVVGADVEVIDMGVASDLTTLFESGKVRNCKVGFGTANFAQGPAMSREQAIECLERGIKIALELADSTDIFGTGEMGIGNTSPSSAIVTVLAGERDPAPYVGRGAGLAVERLAHKSEVIRRGIALNQPDSSDGIDVLAKVGGFEIGGIAGLILGAASCRKPVVIDGFISSAGALIAGIISPESKDYMILAHGSAEPGHVKMAELLGKKPLLDLGMRLGEGTGAALAMSLVDAASAIMNKMATFESAGVSIRGLK